MQRVEVFLKMSSFDYETGKWNGIPKLYIQLNESQLEYKLRVAKWEKEELSNERFRLNQKSTRELMLDRLETMSDDDMEFFIFEYLKGRRGPPKYQYKNWLRDYYKDYISNEKKVLALEEYDRKIAKLDELIIGFAKQKQEGAGGDASPEPSIPQPPKDKEEQGVMPMDIDKDDDGGDVSPELSRSEGSFEKNKVKIGDIDVIAYKRGNQCAYFLFDPTGCILINCLDGDAFYKEIQDQRKSPENLLSVVLSDLKYIDSAKMFLNEKNTDVYAYFYDADDERIDNLKIKQLPEGFEYFDTKNAEYSFAWAKYPIGSTHKIIFKLNKGGNKKRIITFLDEFPPLEKFKTKSLHDKIGKSPGYVFVGGESDDRSQKLQKLLKENPPPYKPREKKDTKPPLGKDDDGGDVIPMEIEEDEEGGDASLAPSRPEQLPPTEGKLEIMEEYTEIPGVPMTIFSLPFRRNTLNKSAYLLHPNENSKVKRYILIDCLPESVNLYEVILNRIGKEQFPYPLQVCLTDTDERFGGTGVKHFFDKPNVIIYTFSKYIKELECTNKKKVNANSFIAGLDDTNNSGITCLTYETQRKIAPNKTIQYFKMLYYFKGKGILFMGQVPNFDIGWWEKNKIIANFAFDSIKGSKNMVYTYDVGHRIKKAKDMIEVYNLVLEHLNRKVQPEALVLPREDNLEEWVDFSETHKKIGKILENLDMLVTLDEILDENTKKKIIFLQNIISGPKIMPSPYFGRGYGLFADTNTTKNTEIQVFYGGTVGDVYNDDDDKNALEGDYVVTIENPKNEKELRDINGLHSFKLSEKGRWINQDRNLLNILLEPSTGVDFDNGKLTLESMDDTRPIVNGAELFADYGGDYQMRYNFVTYVYKESKEFQFLENLPNQITNLQKYWKYLKEGGKPESDCIHLEDRSAVTTFLNDIDKPVYNDVSKTLTFRKGEYFVKIIRINILEDETENTKGDALREMDGCMMANKLSEKSTVFAKTLGAFYSDVVPDSNLERADFYLYLVMPFYENIVQQIVDPVSTFLELCIAIYYGRLEFQFQHGDINTKNLFFVMDRNTREYTIGDHTFRFTGIKPVLIDYGRSVFGSRRYIENFKEKQSDLVDIIVVWPFLKIFNEDIAFAKYLEEFQYLMKNETLMKLFEALEAKKFFTELLTAWDIDEENQKNLTLDGRFNHGNIKFVIENFPFDYGPNNMNSIENITIYDPKMVDLFIGLIKETNKDVYIARDSKLQEGLRGLFAKRNFQKGEFICEYGGFLSATEPYYDHFNRNYAVQIKLYSDAQNEMMLHQVKQLELAEEAYKKGDIFEKLEELKKKGREGEKDEPLYAGKYEGESDEEEEEEEDEHEKLTHAGIKFYLDGEHHFKLNQLGSFANGVPWTESMEPTKEEQNNATMVEKYFKVSLHASRDIKQGEEILVEYGDEYYWEDIYPVNDLKKWGIKVPEKESFKKAKKVLPRPDELEKIQTYASLDVMEDYVKMILSKNDPDEQNELWKQFVDYLLEYTITKVEDKHRALAIVKTIIAKQENPKFIINDDNILCANIMFDIGDEVTTMSGMVTRENVFGIPGYEAMKFGQWWIFPHMCYLIEDFGNHAKKVAKKAWANCKLERDIREFPTDGYYIKLIATRKINPGDPITYFY